MRSCPLLTALLLGSLACAQSSILNGDETDQGEHWRISPRELAIQRCVVYRYE